jgi:membrane protein DedA with SNARE-associated domain
MSLEELVRSYGYVAVLAGTLLEGETVVVIAGFLAHLGYLRLPWVMALAFLGTLICDQLFFYIGRTKGNRVLDKRPAWKAKSVRVRALLQRYQDWLILSFRFLYGLRTITPFLIGLSHVGRLRYLLLNAVGALVWAVAVGFLGYFLGGAAEVMLGEVKRYEVLIMAVLALLGGCLWLGCWLRNRPREGKA